MEQEGITSSYDCPPPPPYVYDQRDIPSVGVAGGQPVISPPTGGYGPQTGGYGPQTGGYVPQAGGYGPQTGAYGPQTGGYGPPTGGYVPQTGGYGPEYEKTPLNPLQNVGYQGELQGGPYAATPGVYGQQPQLPPQTVIFVAPTPLTDPPDDHLGYSIFVTICCCWIIGIFAIIKSAECRSAVAAGDRPKAQLMSRQAKRNANIALGVGIIILIVALVRILVTAAM